MPFGDQGEVAQEGEEERAGGGRSGVDPQPPAPQPHAEDGLHQRGPLFRTEGTMPPQESIDLALNPFQDDVAQSHFVREAAIHQVDLRPAGEPPGDLAQDGEAGVGMESDIDPLHLAGKLPVALNWTTGPLGPTVTALTARFGAGILRTRPSPCSRT